jgi:hypothetical protein
MKLAKAVISFPADAKSVVISIPDTEFSVVFKIMPHKGQQALVSTVTPVKYAKEDTFEGEMPDELEMLVAQGHMMMTSIGHYLTCEKHRVSTRVELCRMQTRTEKFKVLAPHLSEMQLVTQVMSITTGLPQQLLLMTGVVKEHVESKPNEYEKTLLAKEAAGESTDVAGDEAAVVLDFVPFDPVPLPEEDALYDRLIAAQRAERETGIPTSAALH